MNISASPKEDAVSPVIGTILLVALTVVLVGIIGAVLMGFGMAEPAPILGIAIGSQGDMITVTHLNGAELPAGSYKILVDGVDKTASFGGTRDFGPGITLRWDSGSEAVGTVSVVYTSEKGVSTLLAEKRIGKAGSGGGGF
jgi:porphobilinogen synthase